MGVLTPTLVTRLEDRMKSIVDDEYLRLTSNLWWTNVAKTHQSQSARELITWLLDTATIKKQGKGGNIAFDDLVAQTTTIENEDAGSGLKITRNQLTDLFNGIVGGAGMDVAAKWARNMGAYMAYWPQKQTTYALKNGETATIMAAYDTLALFASAHPVNPYDATAGTYANLHKTSGGASGAGALPIDVSVSPETALTNLSTLFSYLSAMKMPNGEDPRFLTPKAILCSPKLFPRAVQLTSAKFLGQAVGSAAATSDVEALIKALGFATPIMAHELAGFESDTTYFVVCEEVTASQLGGVIYQEREPFSVTYYDTTTQAALDRARELEWHVHGRNAIAAGHPYLIHKVKGA